MECINFNSGWTFWNRRRPEKKCSVHLPHDAMQTETRLRGVAGGSASGFYPGGRYVYEKRFPFDPNWEGKSIFLEFDGVYMNSTVLLNGCKVGGRIYGYSHFSVDLTSKLLHREENILRVEVDNSRIPNSRWYSGSGIYRDVRLLIGGKTHIRYESTKLTTVQTSPAKLRVQTQIAGFDPNKSHSLQIQVKYLGCFTTHDIGYKTDADYAALITRAPCVASETVRIQSEAVDTVITIPKAKLWSAETPELYAVCLSVLDGGTCLDEEIIRYGIRSLTWNAATGLCINGKAIKLRGGCIHHDNGMLGACEHRKAAFRRIRILKDTGFNAIRMAHHPTSKVLLDACDELGMYVYEESFDMWENTKNDYDYAIYFASQWHKDLTAIVAKDYNRPSVILYGIGNEITDMTTQRGRNLQKQMLELMHLLDPTRPITNACMGSVGFTKVTPLGKEKINKGKHPEDMVDPYEEKGNGKIRGSLLINIIVTWMPFFNKLTNRADKTQKNAADVLDELDIVGFNYANGMVDDLSALRRDILLLNTETYPKDIGENWPKVMEQPNVIGDFMWTAWDYLGETGVGLVEYNVKRGNFSKPYPCVSAGIGAIDMTGFVEAQGHYAKAVWTQTDAPYIGVRPVNHSSESCFMGQWRGTDAVSSWSWEGCAGKVTDVEIYAHAPQVELFINGHSSGKKETTNCTACYQVVYQPGEIKAIAYDRTGKQIGESTLESAAEETVLKLTLEQSRIRADGEDIGYITIEIADPSGICKANSDCRIFAEVNGAATLAGLCSGNPVTEDPFTGNTCRTWYGRAVAAIRSNGKPGNIQITISADGLSAETVTLYAE